MILLFDLDDTLLDDRSTKNYYLPRLFEDYRSLILYDYQTFANTWISAIPKYYKLYTEGKISFEEQRLQRVKEAFNNEELNKNDIQNILKSFDIHFSNSWKLFPGWADFLKNNYLSKAIVTNGNARQQNAKIDKLRLRNYFKHIFISEEIGMSKPNPEIFEYVCNTLNVKPEQCIFIGDSLYYDVLGSSKFGMKTIWLNHLGESASEKLVNVEIFDSVENIIKRIKELE
jgi:putative hydrolase of the HAD superfamily